MHRLRASLVLITCFLYKYKIVFCWCYCRKEKVLHRKRACGYEMFTCAWTLKPAFAFRCIPWPSWTWQQRPQFFYPSILSLWGHKVVMREFDCCFTAECHVLGNTNAPQFFCCVIIKCITPINFTAPLYLNWNTLNYCSIYLVQIDNSKIRYSII